MFFKKLSALLAVCKTLSIVMAKDEEGTITLAVTPKMVDDKQPLPPIIMTGTAEQLDENFSEAWAKIEGNTGIISNINMFLNQAKELEKNKGKDPKKDEKKVPPATSSNTNKEKDAEKSVKEDAAAGAKPLDLFASASVAETKKEEPKVEPKVETPTPNAKPEPVKTKIDPKSSLF